MQIPICAVCGVRCAVCGVRCAVCGVRCAVCGVRCAVCGVRCAVCGVRCAVCGVRCAVCGVRCAVCGVRCAVCGVRCAVCGVRCAVCGVRCAVCGVRCAGPCSSWVKSPGGTAHRSPPRKWWERIRNTKESRRDDTLSSYYSPPFSQLFPYALTVLFPSSSRTLPAISAQILHPTANSANPSHISDRIQRHAF